MQGRDRSLKGILGSRFHAMQQKEQNHDPGYHSREGKRAGSESDYFFTANS
jgi:hypothetical protein